MTKDTVNRFLVLRKLSFSGGHGRACAECGGSGRSSPGLVTFLEQSEAFLRGGESLLRLLILISLKGKGNGNLLNDMSPILRSSHV